jgi:signal transduction histidine kinase
MDLKKSLVLVVDDISSNVEFITDILITVEDIDVEGVNNGPATLEFVKKHKPDLILLDISMPSMDGFEVCRTLKADKNYSDIPIIFLTARVQKEDIVKGFELGAVDYISKPFNLSELLSRVKTHLELRHKSKELLEMNQNLEEKVEERTRQLIAANEQLTATNEKLSKMYDELSALDHAKNDFIAHINHELRTPLNGILGYTSLLEETLKDEEKTYLNSINALVSRLIKVAEISLLLTELRTVDDKISIRKISLLESLNNAIPEDDLQKKNINIKIQNLDGSIFVSAEPRMLISCISVILDNSIKYSPVHGTITVSCRDNNNFYTLEVSDNGPGFSSTALSTLFELFTADNLDHKSHGFGIGLATAKRIMDLLGGKINIRNKEKGASVLLHLKKN